MSTVSDKNQYVDFLKAYSPVVGSPNSTYGRRVFDSDMSDLGDFTPRIRKEINHHLLNGTDIAPIIEAIVAGTVGEKVNLQARTQVVKVNKQFESLLLEHSRAENFDVTQEWHRDHRFRDIIRFEAQNGGVLVKYHYNTTWKIPIKIELIPVSKIDTSKHNPHERLVHGLQRNKYNVPVGIYLYTDLYNMTSKYFSMKDIVFYHVPWISLNQTLAVTRLVTLLSSLDDIFTYTSSEVKSAIEKAKTGVYWHTQLYSTIAKALHDMQEKEGDTSVVIKETKELLNELGARGIGQKGATPILQDDKITTLNNNPESIYEPLMNQIELKNTSSAGVSQVASYKDGSKNNYAGLQAIRGHDEGSHKMRFNDLANKVIDDYMRRLFRVGVQIGRIKLTSKQFFGNEETWYKWDILRTANVTLDAQKEANAVAKSLASKTTTLTKEYSKKGLDYQEETLKQVSANVQVVNDARAIYTKAGLPIPDEYKTQEELNQKEEINVKDN